MYAGIQKEGVRQEGSSQSKKVFPPVELTCLNNQRSSSPIFSKLVIFCTNKSKEPYCLSYVVSLQHVQVTSSDTKDLVVGH